jgi:hypothetical protein
MAAADRLDRVFIDTSELFPFTLMDVLLTLTENRLFIWRWSEELLDEWEEVIVREGQRSPQSAHSVTTAIRTFFSHRRIDPALYQGRATEDLSPDPDDRVHVAAAIFDGVQVALTGNLRHWRTGALREAGVRVMTADDYLCELLVKQPNAVTEAFTATARGRKNPPTTAYELAERVAGAGAPNFAARITALLDGADPDL